MQMGICGFCALDGEFGGVILSCDNYGMIVARCEETLGMRKAKSSFAFPCCPKYECGDRHVRVFAKVFPTMVAYHALHSGCTLFSSLVWVME